MKKNILIIHYNTPHLTECLVRSINLLVKNAVIYIFDNSSDKPFTAKFDNVTIFDNTKGQIIDFEKWLEKYPNRAKSNGRTNNWGSAKHCYSVEKCMELINDNFILLDSDVLLKKDISPLFEEDKLFVGEIAFQPQSTIRRILPFICYINVKMCKEKGVHYFDENFMHGLYITPTSDRFDTGGGFYLSAKEHAHRAIICDDYIVHYRHGSWDKKGYIQKYSHEEWLQINRRYWDNINNKKVVYTCITNDYDILNEPKYISLGFDYICFTDNSSLKSDVWQIRPLPKETEGLSEVKKQRFIKINPHLYLKEYDISIWVDGNVELKGDLNELIDWNVRNDCSIYVPKHPQRNCIYNESQVVIRMRKDKEEIIKPQIKRYKEEGFPKDYGLLQSNIMIRKHNEEDCIRLMKCWFYEVKNGSHRDQLSFNYVAWKNNDIKVTYLDKNIYKSKYFYWNGKHNKKLIKANELNGKTEQTKTIKELKEEFNKLIQTKIT